MKMLQLKFHDLSFISSFCLLIFEVLGLFGKDNERHNQENDQEPQKMLSSSKCDKDPSFAFFCVNINNERKNQPHKITSTVVVKT